MAFLQNVLAVSLSTCVLAHATAQNETRAAKDITVMNAAEFAERYPAGAIKSIDSAETALGEIKQQRMQIDNQHSKQEEACMPNFFTNNCLDNAKEQRRKALAILRPIEIEANAFKRRARVEERDRELAGKQSKAAASDRKQAGSALGDAATEQATLTGTSGVTDPVGANVGQDARNVRPMKERVSKSAASEAAARQRSMAAYDKKLADSLKRQQAVAARKAEAEQKRLRKQGGAQASSPTAPMAAPPEVIKP